MNFAEYLLTLTVLAGFFAWQLATGMTYGVWWWRRQIFRRDTPLVYWAIMAVQGAIWVIVLATGRRWHVR